MTDWRVRYADKLMTAEQAVARVPPGCRVLIGSGAAEPGSLVSALCVAPQMADNEVVHLLTLGPAPYVALEQVGRFRHCAFFIGANVREAVREGRADFMPVFLSDIPQLIRSRRVRVDVALVQVSPPDAHGYVSLGVSVDVVRAAVDSAERVLAEVNPRMPRTLGDAFVHVSRLDALVPVDTPLPTLEEEPLDEVSMEIGRHVASLVPDGATIQVGIGRIPDAVLAALKDRRDLGVHTEMLSDGVRKLAEMGVITGRKKTLLPGKMVTSFLMGSEALYRWADNHPAIDMRPSDFTNDPAIIAQNDRMISINSALSVDLTGQVAADSIGGQFFSGIGGQVDFVRGAKKSRDGRAIIALPSRAKRGTVSRIVAALEPGAGVVTSRGDVHYVVTEHGVADLWGKSIRERALALIAIAHPDHRAELLAAAKGRRFVFPNQPVPRGRYPWSREREVTLLSHERVLVRPMRITDERGLQELMYRLSEQSVYRRFMGHKRTHPHEEMLELVDLDYQSNMALVACMPGSDEVLGVVRYDVDPVTGLADTAFAVRDDWQGKGIGTALMEQMIEIASERGLKGFTLDVLADNEVMISIIHRSGLSISADRSGDTYHFTALFQPQGTVPA